MNKSSSSFQNFNQVEILHIHKTNFKKKENEGRKKSSESKKKHDRRRLREILRTLQRWRKGRLKKGQDGSGKTLWEVNSDQSFFIHGLNPKRRTTLKFSLVPLEIELVVCFKQISLSSTIYGSFHLFCIFQMTSLCLRRILDCR